MYPGLAGKPAARWAPGELTHALAHPSDIDAVTSADRRRSFEALGLAPSLASHLEGAVPGHVTNACCMQHLVCPRRETDSLLCRRHQLQLTHRCAAGRHSSAAGEDRPLSHAIGTPCFGCWKMGPTFSIPISQQLMCMTKCAGGHGCTHQSSNWIRQDARLPGSYCA